MDEQLASRRLNEINFNLARISLVISMVRDRNPKDTSHFDLSYQLDLVTAFRRIEEIMRDIKGGL